MTDQDRNRLSFFLSCVLMTAGIVALCIWLVINWPA
jgi:hypothetical protein